MIYALKFVSVQAVLLLLIGINDVSTAKYADVQYSGYGNRPTAVQKNLYNREQKVQLRIYYETHCPYTVRFFKEQLAPTVERLAPRLDVHMIPYGHAKTTYKNGQLTFHCHHGDIECYANRLHACAIDVIRSNTLSTLFNICIIGRTYDYNVLNDLVYSCGRKYNISTGGIWQCMNSDRSSHLLKIYGDETRALRPRHVPYVTLNGSAENQGIITQYLGYSVCRALVPQPVVCRTG